MKRRHYLGLFGVSVTPVLAGCSSDPDVEESGNGGDDASGEGDDASGEGEEQEVFEFGSEVEFFDDEERLIFRPHNARLTNTLFYEQSDRIRSEVPDDDLFLLMDVEMESVGDEEVRIPGTVDFTVDGAGSDNERLTRGVENAYAEFGELRPGVSETATMVFSISETDSEGTLFAEFGTIETITAEWSLDLSTVERDIIDLQDNSVGDTITVGTDEANYELEVTDVESTESYTFTNYLDEEEEDVASDGMEWLFVDIRAENTGQGTIRVPSPRDVQIIADNQQFDRERHSGDVDEYEGRDLSEGIVEESFLLFEIPSDAGDVTIEVDITSDVLATWNVQPDSSISY